MRINENALRRQVERNLEVKQDFLAAYPGTMGDGFNNLQVEGLPNFVYVRVGASVERVYNARIPAENDMLVWVGYSAEQPNLYQVLSMRTDNPAAQVSNVPPIWSSRRFQWMADGGGQDPLFVELRQFLPLRPGVTGDMNLQVYQGFIQTSDSTWKKIDTQDVDLSAHVPTAADQAAFVLITIDDTGTIISTKGSEVDIDLLDYETDLPAVPVDTVVVIAAVRVYTGQTEIQEARTNTDIIDLRLSGGGGVGGAGTLGPTEVGYGAADGSLTSNPLFIYDEDERAIWIGSSTGPIAGFTGESVNVVGDSADPNDPDTARLRAITFGSLTPGLTTYHGDGTLASPTNTKLDMVIGRWSAGGWNDTPAATGTQAEIRAVATENWTTLAQGTKWEILTTPAGSNLDTLTATLSYDGGLVLPVPESITVPTATQHGLTLKTSDDNTTDYLLRVLSSADAVIGGIGALGHIGVAAAPNVQYGILVQKTFTGVGLVESGLNSSITIAAGGAQITQNHMGMQSGIFATGTAGSAASIGIIGINVESQNQQTAGTMAQQTGVSAAVRLTSTGVTTLAVGYLSTIIVSGAGSIGSASSFRAASPSMTGTLTTLRGLHVLNQGHANITSSYGIAIENQSGSATDNYAIFTGTGLNRLGDQLLIVGSADRIQHIVRANATQTTNLAEWQSSASAVLAAMNSLGHVGLGGTNTSATSVIRIVKGFTDMAVTNSNYTAQFTASAGASAITVQQLAVNSTMLVSGTGGASSGVLNTSIYSDAQNQQTAGTLGALIALRGIIRNTNASTLTLGYGLLIQYVVSGAGNVGTMRGVVLSAPTMSSTGVTTTHQGYYASDQGNALITNSYAIYLENQTSSATASYAIFTNAGLHSYLGSYTVASAAGSVWDAIAYRAATLTITGSTNITTATGVNYMSLARPTLSAASALTVTNAATLYIANAPAAGGAGPAAITNAFAIWVDAGMVRFDGGAIFNEDGTATVDFRIESDTEANFFFVDANGSTDGELYMGGTTNGIKIEKGGVLSFIGTAKVKDATNIPFDTTTGSKIGTGTDQKIGFWNATPVIQQTTNSYTSDGEGAAYTGIDNAQAGTPYAQLTDLNQLRVAYETLRSSYDDLRTKLITTGILA